MALSLKDLVLSLRIVDIGHNDVMNFESFIQLRISLIDIGSLFLFCTITVSTICLFVFLDDDLLFVLSVSIILLLFILLLLLLLLILLLFFLCLSLLVCFDLLLLFAVIDDDDDVALETTAWDAAAVAEDGTGGMLILR